MGLLGGSDSKECACNAGDPASIPGLRRSPGKGNGNPLQCLACEIPWTEKPSRLQSVGSQRVGCDRVTDTFIFHHDIMTFFFFFPLVIVFGLKSVSSALSIVTYALFWFQFAGMKYVFVVLSLGAYICNLKL